MSCVDILTPFVSLGGAGKWLEAISINEPRDTYTKVGVILKWHRWLCHLCHNFIN